MERDLQLKICIVSSAGGHLTEVRHLGPLYSRYPHFYVVNSRLHLTPDMRDRTYFIAHAERNWKVALNLWEAWRILRRERPSLLLSTGAGCVVPFAIVGKLLGVRVLFVETAAQVRTPSLSGRIMYYLADRMFYQWRPLARYFPKATYGGPIPWSS